MPPTRFDYERDFTRADGLDAGCRHLLHVLCMRLDKDVWVILPRYQPSITDLTAAMACHRSTTVRRLARLEKAGWVDRRRPSKHDARTKHARTAYSLTYPAGWFPQAAATHYLGASADQARRVTQPGLGASADQARRAMRLKSSQSSMSSQSSTEHVDLVIELVAERTGKRVNPAFARQLAAELIGARRVRDVPAYLRHCIETETDTRRLIPTPTPPRFRRATGFELVT